MQLISQLTLENTYCAIDCLSKKRAIEVISEASAAQFELPAQTIFDALIARERMGSTGIGAGVALPHAKLPIPDEKACALFFQLANPVAFDAVDNQPVDLMLALFIPDDKCQAYSGILAKLASFFTDKYLCRRLRTAKANEELFELLLSNLPNDERSFVNSINNKSSLGFINRHLHVVGES